MELSKDKGWVGKTGFKNYFLFRPKPSSDDNEVLKPNLHIKYKRINVKVDYLDEFL